MFKRFILSLALTASVLSFSTAPVAAAAPQQLTQFAVCSAGVANFLGLEPWYACLQKKYGGEIKITQLNDLWLIVLPILEDLIKVCGYIAVGFIFWGGIKYSKSQGDPGQTGQAMDVIRNAIIGLLWVLLSVAVVEFVAVGLQSGLQ